MSQSSTPNFVDFHKSTAAELAAVKDRIRSLVPKHRPTEGAHKEAALRAVLRRHLSSTIIVGTGFVVTDEQVSTQIDILLVDSRKPTLFRDGDLMIVTPDAVRGIIKVKTKQRSRIGESLLKLAKNAALCRGDEQGTLHRVWSGLFVYEAGNSTLRHATVLRAIQRARDDHNALVNAVCIGQDDFFLFWRRGEQPGGQAVDDDLWRSYEIKGLAPAYFVSNIVSACAGDADGRSSRAWYPIPQGGKEQHAKWQIKENGEPVRFS